MTDLSQRLAMLSPKQRELLLRQLGKKPSPQGDDMIPRLSGDSRRFALSFSQLRQWILERLEPGTSAYVLPGAVRLRGRLNVAALAFGVNELIRRHQALRTTFEEAEPEPLQVVHPHCHRPLPEVDLRRLAEGDREAELERLIAEEAARPFDLRLGPLLRLRLLRLAERDHVFLFTMHHIVSDGWSLGVFFRELGAFYGAFVEGRSPDLTELPIQYTDFAVWQRRRLSGDVLERHLAYWRQQLASAAPQLELPADRPRSAAQTHAGASETRLLPASRGAALRRFAREHSSSLFMVLLAAFKTLLYRCSGQCDLSVGTFIANRNRSQIAGLIGFFVNTLVLRTKLTGKTSFLDYLSRVREVTLDAYAHQDLPFEKLLEELQPERDLNQTPFFQVMCVLQNFPRRTLELPQVSLSYLDVEHRRSHFDLTLWAWEAGDEVGLTLEYRTQLFDVATIRRLAGHLDALLAAAVKQPASCLAMLPLLGEPERHQLLVEWGTGAAAATSGAAVHGLFETRAGQASGAVAVAGEEELSYGELEARANRLARYLRAVGAGPESVVGLAVDRSPEMVVALLAVLKAGAAYLPLDPSYPAERLAFMLEDAGAPVVLTRARLADRLPETAARLVDLDAEGPAIASQGAEPLGLAVDPEALAYVLYTSGSTGRPKGVGVPHRALANYVEHAAREFAISPADRVLQFASMSFDTSAEEIYPCLARGATLVLRDDAMLESVSRFLGEVAARGVTVLDLPTAYWHDLVAAMVEGDVRFPAGCRLVVLGGEKARTDRLASWRRLGPAAAIVNTYGPTEATIVATRWWLRDEIPHEIPIGRPVAHACVKVLDAALRPVPIGVPGELCLGGRGVARGYLGRPGLTAERFVPDAAATARGERLYRTGDLARFLADGNLEFRGRVDHQVKVRGFRVELGEIEAALTRHPAVRDAAVVAREQDLGGHRLAAYLVAAPGPAAPEPSVSELREHLRADLPDYMVPAAFVFLPVLPRTSSGKIDRRALPEPEATRPELDADYAAPRGPVEEFLAEVWAELLGLDRVGTRDSFFELGGHSLLAAQMAGRVRQAFDVELPLLDIFNTPTIAELARRIDNAERAERGLELPPLRRVPRDRPLPLSFPQERVWFLTQLVPGNLAYNFQLIVWLRGPLRVEVLKAALDEIVRRHEIYRTTFPAVDGRPVQVIHPPWRVVIPQVDLRRLPSSQRKDHARELISQTIRQSFDVTRLPLVRWILFRIDEEHWGLLHAEHHFVHDGWSIAVLLRELMAIYKAFAEGRPSPLCELPVQFADFAAWQRGWMQGEVLERQMQYWKARLAANPPQLELPADRPRPRIYSFRGGNHVGEIETGFYQDLRTLSREQKTTLFMTFTAAFATLLHRHSGQAVIPLGAAVANRRLRETEGLIGMIVNTLVLSINLEGDPTFTELLRRVRQVLLEAHTYQDMPFEKLVEELQPERDLSRNPLFQAMFSFHDSPVPYLEFAGLRGELEGRHNLTAKTDLNVIVVPRAEQHVGLGPNEDEDLEMGWEYNRDIFDATTVSRLSERYKVLLRATVTHPDLRLSALPLLTAAEAHQVLAEWNDVATNYPGSLCLHQLFEAQVGRTPAAVALELGDARLEYAELNRRSNRLARHLRSLGVGPDVLVGVFVERSLAMVVALLGVLKAGGAYVPFDPVYPGERIAFMLADSAAPVVLTQEDLLPRLPAGGRAQVVCLDGDGDVVGPTAGEGAGARARPENLAYVIYTSGSTGRPKGVAVTHANAARLLAATEPWFRFGPADVWTLFHSAAFDFSVWELWGALAYGGRLVVVPYWVSRSPAAFWELLLGHGVTVLNQTPSAFRQLVEAAGDGEAPALRSVIFGGEALELGSLRPWFERFGDERPRLVNMYGITETTVHVTYRPLGAADLDAPGSLIGRQIPDLGLGVLDRRLRPAPIGVPGEICVGGAGLARGYLGRPALTAERFVPDPWSGAGGGRLYKSGDQGRWLAAGEVEYLGRLDRQVKIRGFRVELGEIESALVAHPGVGQAVVMEREDEPGDRRLVAYLLPADGTVPEVAEIRDFLRRTLPPYMVPAAFVPLAAFPLTPNGKIDRRSLPAPDRSRPATEAVCVAPRDALEEELVAIWSEVLGVDLGVRDDFFYLGGHSLSATRVLSRIRARLGVEVPVAAFFEAPTVEELALTVSRLRGEPAAGPPDEPVYLGERIDRVDELSDADLDALVAEMVEEREAPR